MNNYAKKFPIHILPHVSEAKEIIDPIHNYRRPQPTEKPSKSNSQTMIKGFVDLESKAQNTALTQGVPTLSYKVIQISQREI